MARRTLVGLLGSGDQRDRAVVPLWHGTGSAVSRANPNATEVEEVVEPRGGVDTDLPVVRLARTAGAALSLQRPGQAHLLVASLGDLVGIGSHHDTEGWRSGVFVMLLDDQIGLQIVRPGGALGLGSGQGRFGFLGGWDKASPRVRHLADFVGSHLEFLDDFGAGRERRPGEDPQRLSLI